MPSCLANGRYESDTDADFSAELALLSRPLKKYAQYLSIGSADADDLVQDTMLRCWVSRRSYQPGTNIGAWARTIMRNRYLSIRRQVRPIVDMSDDVLNAYLSSPQTQEHALELRDTYWALGELTPDHRDAVLLAGEGYTMEQAARQLDISIGAFKTRLMRARIRLRCLNDGPATPKLSPVKKQCLADRALANELERVRPK